VANTIFSVNQSRIFEGPGRFCYNWWLPGAGAQTIVDGSTPPQLVPPVSPPVYQTSHAYSIDDQFSDTTNIQRVVDPGTSQSSGAPTWNTQLFGLTTDTGGVTYMNLGPIGGTFLGATEGAMEVDIQDDTADVSADQFRAPLLRFAVDCKASITVDLLQTELDFIARGLAASQYSTGTNSLYPTGAQAYEAITFGGVNSPFVPKVCLVAIMQKPGWSAPSKSHIVTLYGASVGKQGIKMSAQLKKANVYKVKFDGLTVASRADYDQIGQWVNQT
jgi:hypothetical protein